MAGKKLTLTCLLVALTAFSLFAQHRDAGSKSMQLTNATAYFNKAIGEQSYIYNGRAYDFYPLKIMGSAYFADAKTFENGDISYNGGEFEHVPLKYDLNKDLVISLLNNGFVQFSLESEKVKEFTLSGHHFVRLEADLTKKNTVSSGFYDVIYSGRLKVLVKRSKSIQTNTDNNALIQYFRGKNNYYLEKDGNYYNIDSEGEFLSVFKSNKNELRKQLKASGIKYKNDPEKASILLATYLERLTN